MTSNRLPVIACWIVLAGLCSPAHSQDLSGRWLYGFSLGTQKFIGNQNDSANILLSAGNAATGRVVQSGYGLGLSGSLERRFFSRLGLGLSLGYATLPFNLRLNLPNFTATSALRTQLLYSELLFDYELANQTLFRPYLMLGAGYLNFRVADSKRLHGGKGLIGAGARVKIRPQMMLNAGLAYNFQASDNLDAANNGKQDGFVSARLGVSFITGGAGYTPKDLFSENRTRENRVEPAMTPSREGKDSGRAQKASAGEVERKNRFAANNAAARANQSPPIAKSNPAGRAGSAFQAQPNRSRPAARARAKAPSFPAAYEQALQSFYAQQYAASVQQFSNLITHYPTHVLVHNCHYWLGKAQFELKDYPAAIVSFKRVLLATKSAKQDDALFLLGSSLLEVRRPEEARQTLQRLVQSYPESALAGKAKELLAKM